MSVAGVGQFYLRRSRRSPRREAPAGPVPTPPSPVFIRLVRRARPLYPHPSVLMGRAIRIEADIFGDAGSGLINRGLINAGLMRSGLIGA